jgi:hypothetical protein
MNSFSLLIVPQQAVGMIKTSRVSVIILFYSTDVVGLEPWHRSREGYPFPRRCRTSSI